MTVTCFLSDTNHPTRDVTRSADGPLYVTKRAAHRDGHDDEDMHAVRPQSSVRTRNDESHMSGMVTPA